MSQGEIIDNIKQEGKEVRRRGGGGGWGVKNVFKHLRTLTQMDSPLLKCLMSTLMQFNSVQLQIGSLFFLSKKRDFVVVVGRVLIGIFAKAMITSS